MYFNSIQSCLEGVVFKSQGSLLEPQYHAHSSKSQALAKGTMADSLVKYDNPIMIHIYATTGGKKGKGKKVPRACSAAV